MSPPIALLGVVAVICLVLKQLSVTDIPKIKGVPEIPGVPIFGNLIQLGKSHARSCRKLAQKYGPIFQIRLGNRVRLYQMTVLSTIQLLTKVTALYLRKRV